MKGFISILLSIIFILSCFTAESFAFDDGGYVLSDESRIPFEDVDMEAWYGNSVKFCYANGVIKGMDDYTFAPSGNITRAQFAMMLANLEGVDTSKYNVSNFKDVKPSHWYYGAVAWAYNEGIVYGTHDDLYEPNLIIQRQALCRMIALYMQRRGYEVEINKDALKKFNDRDDVAFWAEDEVYYAVSAGLVSGMKAYELGPKLSVTRAQAARILMLYLQNYRYAGHDHIFYGQNCTQPGICSCGMVEGLAYGHKLEAYDCVTGGVCKTCNQSVEPSKLIHDFIRKTCDQPRECTRCGVKRGSGIAHKFTPATCAAPKTCNVCGVKVGEPLAHIFYGATCTEGPKCGRCGAISGKAVGHTVKNGRCGRCGKEVYENIQGKVLYYLKQYGEQVDGYYLYESNSLSGIGHEFKDLIYNISTGRLCYSYENTYENKHSLFILDITQLTDKGYMYEHYYEDLQTGEVIYDSGYISKHRVADHSGYSGDPSSREAFVTYSESFISRALSGLWGITFDMCGKIKSLEEFGFILD